MEKKTKILLTSIISIVIICCLIFTWYYYTPITNPKNGSNVHGIIKFTTDFSEESSFSEIVLKVDNITVDWWGAVMNCICPIYLSYDTHQLSNGWHYFQVSRYHSSIINSTYMLKVGNL